jgi:hypothetical protein
MACMLDYYFTAIGEVLLDAPDGLSGAARQALDKLALNGSQRNGNGPTMSAVRRKFLRGRRCG